MKIRKFNENVIVPDSKKFDVMDQINKGVQSGEIKSIEDLNNIASDNGFVFITHSDFTEQMKDVKDVAETMPRKGDRQMIPQVLWFMVMNKKTEKISIVIDDNFNDGFKQKASTLLGFPILVSMLKHEDIHRKQIERMGDSKYYIISNPTEGSRADYLSDPNEIMAFAFSIIEDLKNDGFKRDEILNKLKEGDLSFSMGRSMTGGQSSYHPIYFDYIKNLGKDSKVFKKLRKYMYLYTLELFDKDNSSEENIHDKINLNQEMSKIKKFEAFVESVVTANEPKTAPTKPGTKPAEPGTKPQRPNPRRRIKPSVKPRPKAEAEDYTKSLIDRFDKDSSVNDKKEIVEYYAKKNK